MTGDPSPNRLNAMDALELVSRRREPVGPRLSVANFFQRVPTTLERWNSVPGVVKLVECDPSADGVPVVVAEPVDGTPLSEAIRRAGVLDVARAVRLAIGLGETLESLHNVGLVHGNLGADAVLVVGDDEQVMVLPPPLATLAERADRPDIRESERADLLAFGRVLYEMLVGIEPCHGAGRNRGDSARDAAPVPIGKRHRGIAPLLERLVMELLTSARAQLDISEVVNLLWIEQERLRGRGPQLGAPRYPGEFRRLVVGAAVATCVTLGWLSTARSPAPTASPDRLPVPAAGTPSPLIARPPALPAWTVDREAPESLAAPAPVAAAPARVPAAARARVRAPRPATSGLAARRQVAEGIAIEPPPPPPQPPMGTPAPSRPADLAPAAVGSAPGAEAGVSPAPSPVAAQPTLAASQRPGSLAETSPTTPLPPTVREGEPPRRPPLELLPEVALAPMAPSMPTDSHQAARVMLVRGAPGPDSEAGPSALDAGYGASGAAGIIEGRLGPVARSLGRQSLSGLASSAPAGHVSAEPGDAGQGR